MYKARTNFYQRFTPGISTEERENGRQLLFAFKKNELLVRPVGETYILPELAHLNDFGKPPIRRQFLGTLDDRACYSAELAGDFQAAAQQKLVSLRAVFGKISEMEFALAGLAFQVVEWDRTHQFCSCCGERLVPVVNERAKECPVCELRSYPRLSPAVIVMIRKGDKILLSRSPHFPPNMYSVLAGFVEAGETLEEAVQREVTEEVGIRVRNIKYFGSQPWPFPNSLMIGFTADYDGGEISIADDEIEDAAWYDVSNMPKIPGRISISRALIDHFLMQCQENKDG